MTLRPLRFVWLYLLCLLCLNLWLGRAFAQNESQALATFPLDALQPNMTGYGVTAGAGNVLHTFDVTVLALQNEMISGSPVVLVRTGGAFIDQSGGVSAGMSGSPIYLEHGGEPALLGAIGYTFPSSDHYLALVTPIHAMQARETLSQAPNFGDQHLIGLGEPAPVSTPLLMAGLSERVAQRLAPLFEGTGLTLMPVQIGGVGGFDEEAYELTPGAAISVKMVQGDATLAGVGTLTAVSDGQFWGFGHQFLGQSHASYILSPAFVTHIVPSDITPFKLANNGSRVLGTVTSDNMFAIHGVLDQAPAMVLVTLKIVGFGKSLTKQFDIVQDERFYGPLSGAATLQIMDELLNRRIGGTADVAWELSVRQGETVRIVEQVADLSDIAAATSGLISSPFSILSNNIFAVPDLEKASITITLDRSQRVAEIMEVQPDASQEELSPGDTALLYVRMQPYRGDAEVKTLRVPLPEEESGDLTLHIRGGDEISPVRDTEENDLSDALTFEELMIALREQEQANELIVETLIAGEPQELYRDTFPYLIFGMQEVTVNVVDPDAEEEKEEESAEDCCQCCCKGDVPSKKPASDKDSKDGENSQDSEDSEEAGSARTTGLMPKEAHANLYSSATCPTP